MSDLSTGKSILICGIILSCFAVLWPKIFYPMLFGNTLFSTKMDGKDTLRQERQSNMHPDYAHPALKERGKMFYGEEGKQLKRSADKDMRHGPGPVPGMRPTFGGPGMPTPAPRSQGTMGVLMPMYTIGIIVFFVYTIMKIIFQMNETSGNEPLYNRKITNSCVEETSSSPPNYGNRYSSNDFGGNSLYLTKKINENVENLHQEILDNERLEQPQKPQQPHHSIMRCNDAACQQLNQAKIITDKTEDLLLRSQSNNNKSGDPRDLEINLLRQRLEETEKAMERIMAQMGGIVQEKDKNTEPTSAAESEDALGTDGFTTEQIAEEAESEENDKTDEKSGKDDEPTSDENENNDKETKKDK